MSFGSFPAHKQKKQSFQAKPDKIVMGVDLTQRALPAPVGSSMVPLYGAVRGLLDKSHVVLHFVSSVPGEGTSSVAREFAAMASSGGRHRVLLLDADRHNGFAGRGLVEGLNGGMPIESIVENRQTENFWRARLSDGDTAISAADLRNAYGECRKNFELTVVDCPSVTGGHYTDMMPEATNGVVMVIRAESLRAATIGAAKGTIENLGGSIVGAILNGRKSYIPDFVYRYL